MSHDNCQPASAAWTGTHTHEGVRGFWVFSSEANVRPALVCSGTAACEVHPNILTVHPTDPVVVEFEEGKVEIDFSGSYEQAERDWHQFKNSDFGKMLLGGSDGQ